MEKVSEILSQYPALRSLKNVSKNMSSGLDGVQTLTVTVDLLARVVIFSQVQAKVESKSSRYLFVFFGLFG